MYYTADDANTAHHAGGEQKAARTHGIDEIPLLIHCAEELEEREAGHRANSRAKRAAKIAKDIDRAAIRVQVSRQATHAVVGDAYKRIEQLEEQIDDERNRNRGTVLQAKVRKEQHDGDRPRNGKPNCQRTNAFPIFKLVIDRPETDERIVDRVPDGADGEDGSRNQNINLEHIG
ncbi:hypothetical protein SDC9_142846 [bioreactor metagenome]|uniref:Uncharacterized protein n=1 Tax=bioreactor metagenome TaxID=1076179 RepID=A0A645E2B1_9ZZZZ